MINLCNRTEYSFRLAFGHLSKVLDCQPDGIAGICDRHGTWGHVAFEKACKKRKIKPIFGVELALVPKPKDMTKQGAGFVRFIARNNNGLRQIYELTTKATEQFYYFPRIGVEDIIQLITDDVFILTSRPLPEVLRGVISSNMFLDLNPMTKMDAIKWARENEIPFVASSDNFFPALGHRDAYEICMGRNSTSKNTPMHILNQWEWDQNVEGDRSTKDEALHNTKFIADQCEVSLPKAKLVHPKVTKTLREMCLEGAECRGMTLNDEYMARMERELQLIAEKEF